MVLAIKGGVQLWCFGDSIAFPVPLASRVAPDAAIQSPHDAMAAVAAMVMRRVTFLAGLAGMGIACIVTDSEDWEVDLAMALWMVWAVASVAIEIYSRHGATSAPQADVWSFGAGAVQWTALLVAIALLAPATNGVVPVVVAAFLALFLPATKTVAQSSAFHVYFGTRVVCAQIPCCVS